MTEEEIIKYCEENDDKINRYITWLKYQIGFTGVGTTELDIKPEFEMPIDLPNDVKNNFIDAGKEWAKYKWNCFCEASKGIDDYTIPENWKCPKIG
jgi:hypothetical protein